MHVETLEKLPARLFASLPERDDLAQIRGEAHAGCMDIEEARSLGNAEGMDGARRGYGKPARAQEYRLDRERVV